MPHRCAVLDDYQNVARKMADWSAVSGEVEVTVFHQPLGDEECVIEALREFSVICLMRERTPFPRAVIEALPNLKLLVTTGARNNAIDVAAAQARGVTVCGTGGRAHHTAELAFGLILDLARNISFEHARLKAGERWQTTLGLELNEKTLGVLGLGKLGSRLAHYARAFDMRVIAWSQNLTPERCQELGIEYVSKEELFRQSDFLSIHLVLSARTRGLVTARDLSLMKPTAFLINTSRGPIVEKEALLDALRTGRIAGAGLDVYDVEPLPLDHPLRGLPNVVLTPHLGYVTLDNYRVFFRDMVADIRAWLDGRPVRVLNPK